MKVIEVTNLIKKFGSNYAVNGVSFNVNEGEIFGFLGRNGAGKTTTINMLTGICMPSGGHFSILGESNIDKIKKYMGVLPDVANYYYNISALEHLSYFAKVSKVKAKKDSLLHILEQVGLKGNEHKRVKEFSFGMKKKLGVAQAIIGDPNIIFLDEPTSGMDPESAIQIQDVIQTLCKQGKTIFLTSHNLNEVEKICARICIMEGGEISKCGTLYELRKNYQKPFLVKIKVDIIPTHLDNKLNNELINYCEKLTFTSGLIECYIKDEKCIPQIIFILSQNNINIYRVEDNQVSLQEIFLS